MVEKDPQVAVVEPLDIQDRVDLLLILLDKAVVVELVVQLL